MLLQWLIDFILCEGNTRISISAGSFFVRRPPGVKENKGKARRINNRVMAVSQPANKCRRPRDGQNVTKDGAFMLRVRLRMAENAVWPGLYRHLSGAAALP
ncbi:hypothetical protein [Pantoea latae]|uniref:hypothetical protein n=1 Tax=Pantoea latae TaxID=1964541 RepID=UPI0011813B74|nr:hypothetical protein [Pantoea latae]